MIGNDVIDLTLAAKESNWRRKGFLQKIFTESEQRRIQTAAHPDLMVWNLWSRKEAAYKIYNKETGIRTFNPLRLECTLSDDYNGAVTIDGRTYQTRTTFDLERMDTVAVSNPDYWPLVLDLARTDVEKKEGLPYRRGDKTPASVSHHGRFEKIVGFNY